MVLFDTASGTPYLGWKLTGSGTGRTWDHDNTNAPGVFYVHQAHAEVSGNPGEPTDKWRATIVAEGQPISAGCEQNYGDIEISGNPAATTYIPGLMFVAGRDLKVNGNPSQSYEGLFGASEQVEVSGNPSLNGAVIAEDRCPDTPSSNIHANTISGSMTLANDGGLDVVLGGLVRTTLWLEL